MKRVFFMVLASAVLFISWGLYSIVHRFNPDPQASKGSFVIVSAPEHRGLEPIVDQFCRARGWDCVMRYENAVDIRLMLDHPAPEFDAVWPAHRLVIDMGDRLGRVRDARPIMRSPVAFGLSRPFAQLWGLLDRPVAVAELAELAEAGELTYIMASPPRSGAGLLAHLAMASALEGREPELKALLSGVRRSAGDSMWLKDLFVAGGGAYLAMVNYESMLVQANRELEEKGLPPLFALYPFGAVADSPLGFMPREKDDASPRAALFADLREHLLESGAQSEIEDMGWRPARGDGDSDVFRREWGMDATPMRDDAPFAKAQAAAALVRFQETLRRPSLTAFCLDFSASMSGAGEAQAKGALHGLFDPTSSRRRLLQPTPDDAVVAIPFNAQPLAVMEGRGARGLAGLAAKVAALEPNGGTDIHRCVWEALTNLASRPDIDARNAAVILLSDGRSDGERGAFARFYRGLGKDIPIYSISFGASDDRQLEELAALSRGRVFDGRKGLGKAFREAMGYAQ